ncbi:hypothetical protein [Fictibacillus macauensis]|nr:hypothetical protein [Fictibacillus macauensis]
MILHHAVDCGNAPRKQVLLDVTIATMERYRLSMGARRACTDSR